MIQRIDHNNNFNALRLCAALLVMLDHALDAFSINIELFTHNSVFGIGIGTFGVTIFFVISGFLVTQSWLNTQRVDLFLLNRAIRIYPALLVNVAITLLLIFISSSFLSSIQTSVELNALIASPFKAFQAISQEIPAILQRVTFILIPDAISKLHNISLWTLPYEVLCYSILCILCFFINPKKSIPIFTILYFILYYNKIFIPTGIALGETHIVNLAYLHCAAFCVGACFCIYKEKIVFNKNLALLAFISLALLSHYDFKFYPAYILSVAYLTLYIALAEKKFIFIFSKNLDISYGIYIYSALVLKVSTLYFIQYNNSHYMLHALLFLSINLLFTIAFAYSSWTYIEKPALKLKRIWNKK